MELKISHSSLRVPAIISRRCEASWHDNRLIIIPIKPTTKNIKSSNSPSKCSANKLTLPLGLYGESRFSKTLLSNQHERNSIRACAKVESDDFDPVLAKTQVKSAGLVSVLDEVLRFGFSWFKFARPYALRQSMISTTCLFARVLVENPKLFKWSVLFKAFPGLIAVMLAFAYANGINMIFDVEIDRINKPYLPIPAGDISLKQAWFFVIFDVLVGLLILQLTNADLITTSFYCLGLLLSTFYSVPPIRFKGSSIATVILVPLICGVIQNVGILYASRSSLGLLFQWSPSIVFITTVATLFFVALSIIKDITDVEGDMKHNIVTFAAVFGLRNIVLLGTGLLLWVYVSAIVAAIYMPQAFNRYLMLSAHSIFTLCLLFQARKLDKANYAKV
ncbi:homogentisate solanesyltransferase, chloroplastic [Morus notabilis]|uniref:homogentisate solanesyltransferase, chloroplastic n=1 Tax=Morus notabilis TaxID=981085 RepID=UPI000CED5C80|nr:homogentisate solanesyltransferase, chloroplastic [Morus notabilis]